MDLVDFRQEVFEKIKNDFTSFASKVFPDKDLHFIPISALLGDNVVIISANMDWYIEGTLLNVLETIPINQDHDLVNQRFPVQYVIRPETDKHHDYRGYAGRVAGGMFHPGDKVTVLPSGLITEITSIDIFQGSLNVAYPPMSVTLTLKDDIDISRGDVIVGMDRLPHISNDITAMICWMNPKPIQINGKYALKHATQEVRSLVRDIDYVLNINTLMEDWQNKRIGMNDIARVKLQTIRPLFYDPYTQNRITGSLILIDESTNETVAAGMIL